MKKASLLLPLMFGSFALFAQTDTSSNTGAVKALNSIRSNTEILSNMLVKTGGLIQSNEEGPAILFLNTQTRINISAFEEICLQTRKMLRLPATLKCSQSSEPLSLALKALSDKNTAAVIIIADLPGYPSLLVAPENRWVMVNIETLNEPGLSAQKFTERVHKETWRALAYLMGAANSNFDHCLMKSVLSPSDLDSLNVRSISPEPFVKILAHAQKIGMKPIRVTTYRKAVEDGWAPAPTNDIQRAIWNELKK